ncbi:MAG: mechanosensitive ion channel [Acidobacteriia bacterium]|nr:mechanosensitive ion channel [Terriglobia bacterium]
MTPNVFKWTDIAVVHAIRLGAILLIALILNRLLRVLTRRLLPKAGSEGLGRIARMREQHVKTLAGLLYSAGTAIILIGAVLTALPEFGFNVTPIAAAVPNGEIAQVANLSRDWGQVFVDVAVASQGSPDEALAALERVSAELRNDAAWSPVLVDGPRVLGIETFGPAGATLRLQLRTVPGRQDDAARELRRRIQNRFEQERIHWGGVQHVEIVGNEKLQGLSAGSNS